MKLLKLASTLLATGTILCSCAGTDLDRSLDAKVAREADVTSRRDLEAKAADLVARTPGLSEEQRQRIGALQARLRARLKELNADSLKLRSLLIKNVLAPGERTFETEAVKSRLRKNGQARIEAIFGAIDEANDALGRSRLIQEAMDLQMMDDQTRYQ